MLTIPVWLFAFAVAAQSPGGDMDDDRLTKALIDHLSARESVVSRHEAELPLAERKAISPDPELFSRIARELGFEVGPMPTDWVCIMPSPVSRPFLWVPAARMTQVRVPATPCVARGPLAQTVALNFDAFSAVLLYYGGADNWHTAGHVERRKQLGEAFFNKLVGDIPEVERCRSEVLARIGAMSDLSLARRLADDTSPPPTSLLVDTALAATLHKQLRFESIKVDAPGRKRVEILRGHLAAVVIGAEPLTESPFYEISLYDTERCRSSVTVYVGDESAAADVQRTVIFAVVAGFSDAVIGRAAQGPPTDK